MNRSCTSSSFRTLGLGLSVKVQHPRQASRCCAEAPLDKQILHQLCSHWIWVSIFSTHGRPAGAVQRPHLGLDPVANARNSFSRLLHALHKLVCIQLLPIGVLEAPANAHVSKAAQAAQAAPEQSRLCPECPATLRHCMGMHQMQDIDIKHAPSSVCRDAWLTSWHGGSVAPLPSRPVKTLACSVLLHSCN